MDMQNKIPSVELPDSWATMPIEECGESLVPIEILPKRILHNPIYFNNGIGGALKDMYIRDSIVGKLYNVIDQFPDEYQLVLYDAWRPIEVQKNLYYSLRKEISEDHPEIPDEELDKITSTYLSFPSENEFKPSPHTTGGSIDLTLAFNGDEIDMGTGFDDFSEAAYTAFFEKPAIELSKTELKIRDNRRMLYHAMLEAGFTNFPVEWWHFDYGNQYWAAFKGEKKAKFGKKSPEFKV